MHYLGIDISKKSFTVSVLDEEGEAITKVLTFPCTHKGFEKLIDKISSLKAGSQAGNTRVKISKIDDKDKYNRI